MVFNESLSMSKLPNDWKQPHITPIFKKGNKSDPANYRPVSLTSCPCKVMESLIRGRIMKHLEENNLITTCQYGFRKGRSCSLQVVDRWAESLDKKVPTDVIFLDFSKVFDAVPHKRLITKLGAYGIAGRTLEWLRDFLSDRQQRVIVQDGLSTWQTVTSGVPQGSVLGLVLFTIFINDMPNLVTSILRRFADNTKVSREIHTEEDVQTLQTDLDTLCDWFSKWLLPFNVGKCKLMHLGSNNAEYKYTMVREGSRSKVVVVEEEKELGVTLDKFRSTHNKQGGKS